MPVAITNDIFWVGVNDLKTDLFEALWPLPHGISYNTYLVRDEKIALIDTVKKDFAEEFLRNIQPFLENGQKIDYLVINHIEPDHSGAIESLLGLYPDLCVIGNERTLKLLEGFYRFPIKTKLVQDRETFALGKHTLEFFLTPMAHWPETMMTFERTSRTLFPGDVFGSFGSIPKGIFDNEVDPDFYLDETRRYFSNVLGKYGLPLQKALSKIKELNIKTIASTHGPIYRKNPGRIIELYGRWSCHETETGVIIAYASMYENTKRMAEAVAHSLIENGVKTVRMHDVAHTHPSFILSDIWQFRGLVLASCTYNTKLFPMMKLLMDFLENDHIENHVLGLLGSYSWANIILSELRDFSKKGPWKLIEPIIEAQCAPSDEVLKQCAHLGKSMAQTLRGS
ncbi:MAG: FprA family A-type flavoprotein [Candidatus Omnitrophota bacterium]